MVRASPTTLAMTSSFKPFCAETTLPVDRKSTRLNSSHSQISYAVFCLNKQHRRARRDDGRVLAERPVVDGLPALLGEGDRQPAAVHDGPDVPHGPPRRDVALRHDPARP